jgi:hypothetical protein
VCLSGGREVGIADYVGHYKNLDAIEQKARPSTLHHKF